MWPKITITIILVKIKITIIQHVRLNISIKYTLVFLFSQAVSVIFCLEYNY